MTQQPRPYGMDYSQREAKQNGPDAHLDTRPVM
jgi:hypothetical protein